MAKKKKDKKRNPQPRLPPDASGAKRTVAIDMQVHKLIESARRSFEESELEILRRLLGLAGHTPLAPAAAPADRARHGRRAKGGGAVDGGWSKIGRHGRAVVLPDGTRVRAAYGGQTIEGEIRSGRWAVAEQTFNSPSAALNAFARTSDGRPVNLNGWRHWEALLPGASVWVGLDDF